MSIRRLMAEQAQAAAFAASADRIWTQVSAIFVQLADASSGLEAEIRSRAKGLSFTWPHIRLPLSRCLGRLEVAGVPDATIRIETCSEIRYSESAGFFSTRCLLTHFVRHDEERYAVYECDATQLAIPLLIATDRRVPDTPSGWEETRRAAKVLWRSPYENRHVVDAVLALLEDRRRHSTFRARVLRDGFLSANTRASSRDVYSFR